MSLSIRNRRVRRLVALDVYLDEREREKERERKRKRNRENWWWINVIGGGCRTLYWTYTVLLFILLYIFSIKFHCNSRQRMCQVLSSLIKLIDEIYML